LDISPIWTPIIAAEGGKLQIRQVWNKYENSVFYVSTLQKIRLFTDDFSFDSTPILATIAMK
jgi:hypothetical protein